MEKKVYDFKTLSLQDMVDYIKANAPEEDKAWFKKEAYVLKETKEGKVEVYNHLKAKKAFCKRYMPEIIPVAKPKAPKASELLANW